MKKLIIACLAIFLSVGSAFARQYVFTSDTKDFKIVTHGTIRRDLAEKCRELISYGFHIDTISMNDTGFVIVYSDDKE